MAAWRESYKEHDAAAALHEIVGNVRQRHARRRDAVNKEHFFAVFGAKFVRADRAVLFHRRMLAINSSKKREGGSHRCLDITRAREMVWPVHHGLDFGRGHSCDTRLERTAQDLGPFRPEHFAGDDEDGGRGESSSGGYSRRGGTAPVGPERQGCHCC